MENTNEQLTQDNAESISVERNVEPAAGIDDGSAPRKSYLESIQAESDGDGDVLIQLNDGLDQIEVDFQAEIESQSASELFRNLRNGGLADADIQSKLDEMSFDSLTHLKDICNSQGYPRGINLVTLGYALHEAAIKEGSR